MISGEAMSIRPVGPVDIEPNVLGISAARHEEHWG
jgi:hypothetical protein